jgi:DNA-binding XRE family transcriptional regulator
MNLLKKIRTENHLTQTEMGKKLGVHAQLISDIETGKLEIRDKHLPKIKKVFGKEFAEKIVKQKVHNYKIFLQGML